MSTTPRQLSRQVPRRRSSRRRGGRVRLRWIALALVGIAVLMTWAALMRAFAPKGDTSAERVDAIIVLGYPSDSDGNPTPDQLARVTEGVKEYERGVAPRLILTGGAAHNQYVEAESMARVARAQGVPDSAIFVEPQAKDTIQNACYSAAIMKKYGWRSAEVVSTGYHLPRAGIIFNNLPQNLAVEWRSHAAPPLQPMEAPGWVIATVETLKTARYMFFARWTESCGP